MRSRRRGRVITLLAPACIAWMSGCAHLPRWMPFAHSEPNSAPAGAAASGDSADTRLLALATSTITMETVRQRVHSLTATGAVAYLIAELHALGLEPAGDAGTFVQRLPVDRDARRMAAVDDAGRGEDSDRAAAANEPAQVDTPQGDESGMLVPSPVSFLATGTQGSATPVFGRDFFVRSTSVSSVHGPLVWAGVAAPGRRAPGPDAAGHVLAFYLPGDAPDKAWHAALSTAVQGSLDANAAAVLIVLDPEFGEEAVAMLASRPRDDAASMMVVGLRYGAAQKIFRNGLRDLDQLRNGPNHLVPVTGTTIALDATEGGPSDEGPANVVAVLPGSDPVLKDTYVVISAPIPQPGVRALSHSTSDTGAPSREPATETASPASAPSAVALLEVARAFAALPERPARSLIVLGATGDHTGRFGSQHFAGRPPVPADRIVASIGIDIAGIVESEADTITAIGQHYTSMGPLVQHVARTHPELDLVAAPDLSPEDDRFLEGDSFSFASIGVPAIAFAAAPEWDPSDAGGAAQADGRIDDDEADRLARVARFIFYFGHALASRAERPIWTAEGRAAAVQKNE